MTEILAISTVDTDCGIARLPDRLAKRIAVQPNGCWEWRGVVNKKGYSQILWEGKTVRVHSLVYRLLNGPLPPGLVPDHLCRVKHCVNPAHLEPVTNRENTLRGTSPSAHNAKKTHCSRGNHPLNGANLRIKQGKYGPLRACRTCERELNRVLQRLYYREGRLSRCRR